MDDPDLATAWETVFIAYCNARLLIQDWDSLMFDRLPMLYIPTTTGLPANYLALRDLIDDDPYVTVLFEHEADDKEFATVVSQLSKHYQESLSKADGVLVAMLTCIPIPPLRVLVVSYLAKEEFVSGLCPPPPIQINPESILLYALQCAVAYLVVRR